MKYTVNLRYDKDADVWIATSNDIRGLILESGSLDVLIERTKATAVELLKLNEEFFEEKIIINFVLDIKQEVSA